LGDEQQEDRMWCLIAIAIASTAPATDCSIPRESVCLIQATLVNEIQWRDDVEQIGYLTLCIKADARAKYLQTRLVERVKDKL
jgi:hypothetical protein